MFLLMRCTHTKIYVYKSNIISFVLFDQWLSVVYFQLARVIGNDGFNEILEAKLPDKSLKPKPDSPM